MSWRLLILTEILPSKWSLHVSPVSHTISISSVKLNKYLPNYSFLVALSWSYEDYFSCKKCCFPGSKTFGYSGAVYCTVYPCGWTMTRAHTSRQRLDQCSIDPLLLWKMWIIYYYLFATIITIIIIIIFCIIVMIKFFKIGAMWSSTAGFLLTRSGCRCKSFNFASCVVWLEF